VRAYDAKNWERLYCPGLTSNLIRTTTSDVEEFFDVVEEDGERSLRGGEINE